MTVRWLLRFVIVGGCAHTFQFCAAQDVNRVLWNFKIVDAGGHEPTLYATARLAPGWHIYSQHLKPGGPMPTKFALQPNEGAYAVIGITHEDGNAVRFFDDIYEMEIVWYAEQVIFRQGLQLLKSHGTMRGNVEFMVCSEEMCIPAEREFAVEW